MITCTLSDKQLRSLRVKVAGDLLDLIKPENTDTFDLKNYLKSIYDVVNNNTGNQNSAIDYARMAGVFIKQVYGRDQRLTALRKKGFVFDQVDDFTIGAADDKTGFDYVANLLEVNSNPAVDLAEVKDQLNIAEQIQQVQNQIVRRNSNTVYGVTRKPASAITTSIQELLGGKEENGTDPRLVFYTKFTKNILNLAGQSGKADLAGIPYEGVTDGLFVTLMRYTEIPIEQTYPHVEEVLRSGVEKDFIIEDYNNAFVYAITDKNGNMIQFDEENKVSDSGRIVYYNARYLPNKDKNNKFDVDNVTNTQTPSEIAKSHGISEDEARENLRKEFELLESSYKYIRGNRGNRIIYSIMGGSYGVTPSVLKPIAFSAVNFDKANITYKFFKKGAISSTSNAGVYAIDGKTGSHYLMINDVISEETIDNLITILTEDVVNEEGNKLSPELKKKILSTYIISDVKNVSYGVDKSTGAFFFNIEGQKVKFSDKAKAKADLKEALQKMDGFPRRYILNTDKANNNENVTLFSITSGAKPVVSTSTVTYDEYLKEYFKVNTAIDSEGSPITYNPYLKLAPVTTETIKVLAPNVAPKATGSPKVVGTAPKTETVQDIYSQLGSTTQTPNVVISNIKTKSGKYDREANIKEAEAKGRIYSMETASDLSFSNPWAHFNRKGTTKTETTEEAVRNYIDWLTTDKFKDVKPKRREWILNQLKSGELKGKAIQYYVELNEPSHVTALDYLINKYDWGTQAPVAGSQEKTEEVNKEAEEFKAKTIEEGTKQLVQRRGRSSADNNTLDKFLNDKDFLDRHKNKLDKQTNIEATQEQIRLAKAWYAKSPLSKHIKLNIMFNAINTAVPNGIARWDVNGITLFKGADFSDVYHEAWHGFTQMFLTQEERSNLYDEARKASGKFKAFDGSIVEFSKATDEQLEEYLAEDFREFMLSKGKKVLDKTPVKKNIFQKIFDFLRSLFGNVTYEDGLTNGLNNPKINELYEKLRVGDLNEYTFNQANVQFSKGLNKLNMEAVDKSNPRFLPEVSYETSKLITSTVDALFSEAIDYLNKGANTKTYTTSLIRTPEGRTVAYKYAESALTDSLYNAILDRNDMVEAGQDTTAIDKEIDTLSWTLANFGDPNNLSDPQGVIKYHMENSRLMEFEDRAVEMKDDSKLHQKNEFESRSGNELSQKSLASPNLIYTIRSLSDYGKDKNVKLNSLGYPMLMDFNRAWNRLMNVTEGSQNIYDVYSKLQAASVDYPMIKQFLDKVGAPSNLERTSQELWTEITHIFTMKRIPLVELHADVDQSRIEGSRDIQTVVKITPVRAGGEYRKVGTKWDNLFSIAQPNKFITVTADNSNILNIEAVLDEFPAVDNKNVFRFMEALGMPLEENDTVKKALANTENGVMKAIKDLHRVIQYGIYKYNNGPGANKPIVISQPSQLFAEYKVKTDDWRLNATLSGENKKFTLIQKFQLAWSDDFSDTTVSNAEGENQYEKSLRSTLSNNIDKINSAQTITELTQEGVENPDDLSMNHLAKSRNPFMKTSLMMQALFDKDGNRKVHINEYGDRIESAIELLNMSGSSVTINNVRNIIDESGIASANADRATKILQDFYMLMLYGVSEATRHADKSSTYLYRLVHADPKKKHFINLNTFTDNANPEGDMPLSSGKAKFIKILTYYLASEYERIQKVKDDPIASNATVGKSTYGKEGAEFVIFDKILDENTKKKLKAFRSRSLAEPVLTAEQFVKQLDKDTKLKSSVEEQIGKYLTSQALEFKLELNKLNFYDNANLYSPVLGSMLNKGEFITSLSEDRKNEIIASMAEAYVANSWIQNYETVVTFYGDPALYNHLKDEFFKRNAGIGATGTIARTDQYMQDYINNRLSNVSYAKTLGLTPKRFGKTMTSAVMGDAITSSVYLDDYLKAAKAQEESRLKALKASKKEIKEGLARIEKLFEAYGEMTEGDGQGWINFDAYRSLLMSINKWSPYQEQLYTRVVNGEDVSVEDLYQFFPVKKMQYWGVLKTEGLPLYGFHKYSLMPLIPNLVKGTNLETLQTKMLQQNIDYALLQSGSKINTITSNGKADKFYADAKSNRDKTLAVSDPEYKFTPNEIFLDNFKDQLEVHDHFSGKVTFSTQLRKLIEDGLMENGVPVDWRTEIKDPEARIEAWEAASQSEKLESDNYDKIIKYEALLNRLVDLKKQQLRNEVGGNLKDLLKFVKKELSRQELADHELAFINEATGDLSYSIELSLSADKIEKMLVAIVQKRLINQKINGEALVQVSGVGFEKANTNMRNATEEEIKKYGTNGLKFYEQKADGSTTAMKIKIAMQGSFKNLLELEDVKQKASDEGLTPLDALNSLIQNDEWLDKGDNRQMVTMLAARIPVQGLNSMEFMEVFEFLPESSGNIVILPAEIVAKSGGDFDIDKMYTLMPNIKKQVIEISKATLEGLGEQLGRKVSRKEVENAINLRENELPLTDTDLEILDYMDTFAQEETKIGLVKGDNVKAIENDLIKSSVEILSMPSNFVSLITPNGTDIVKPVSNDMAKALRGDTGYVSPTEIFEIGRNLYKHQSNSIGKAVLGIIAVNNTFNTLFARTGLVLDQFQAIADDGVTTTYMRQQLRMPHNTIGGNISLSSLYSNEKLATKISDVINQMINGAVDVAKDAWIFDLQGNKEIISSLLFMIQAGVPVRQAVYFVSQPIIREYVDRTRLYKSQFALPMGLPDAGMFYRIMARNSIVEEITDTAPLYNKRGRIDKAKLFGFFDAQASNGENKKLFTEDNLKANIDSKKTEYTETDIAVFSHFLEIQEMASKITQLTQSLKFDNDKTTTLFDARAKLAKISELNNGISDKYIQRISEESPIAAFKIQDFILELYSDLFPLRDDSVLNNALESLYVKNGEGITPIMGIKKGLGMDDEQFQRTFRNDFMHYLFQNEYYKFNPNAKTYSNLNIEVTELESLDAGARVKNNVLYVNKKQIESLFKSGAYSRDSVWKYQFAPVPSYVFDLYDKQLGLNLFTKFVYERETIRTFAENSFDNIKDTEDYQNYYKSFDDTADEGVREYKAYESVLRDKALSNLNLHGYLFYGDKAYGRQIMALKAKYPELFNTYSLLNNLETLSRKYGSSTITNLKFSNTMYTADDLNIYSQNILDLINPSVEKVSDPEENARISKLFEKLPIFAMLQSAGDTRSTLSLLRAIPPSLVTPLLEQPFNNYIDGNTSKKSEDINNYLGVFMQQYAKQNPLKNKLKNFVTAVKAEKTPKQKRVINLSAIEEAEDVVLATETDIEGDSNARILTLGGISVNLDAIGVPFQPNSQQLEALAKMVDFVSEQGSTENALDNMYTLMGYAGTGKTSITKIFLEYLRQSGTDTVVTATTHKAKGVLKKAVGKLAPVITIHKALNLKPNIDISKDINLDKMDMVQGDKALAPELLIIDESSFIGKNLFEFIKTNSLREGTKVLFIGDPAQIKPVESETEETQLSKQNSPVFEVVKNYSELTQVERQADGNPLGPILDSLRSNLKSQKEPFAHVSSIVNNQGIAFTDSGKQFIGQAVEAFKSDNFKKNRNFARLITYTNSRVEEYNKRIRQGLGFTQDYMPGEILMGYDNWRMRKDGTYSINNSVDYVVVDSEYIQEFSLGGNLLKNIGLPEILVSGYNLTIEDITEPGKTTTVFILDSNNDESVYEAIANTVDEIARMAKSANDTMIWAKYYYPFKESFGSNKDIRNKKGGLVLKKLLDYGYAHTIHKSQGATYTNIFVDYASTSKSRDTEERNQMRYVALSRATNIAYAFSGEAQGTPPAVDWNSSFSEEKPVAAATSQVKLTKKTEEEIKTLLTIAVMENLKSGIRTFVVAKDKENGTNVPKKGVLTTESAKLFALDYPDALPVYNETVEADSNIAGTNTIWRDSGIGFGIPTKKTARPTAKDKTKLNTAAAMTENTPEELAENKKVIDEAIAQLVGERDKGKNLIFDAMGYGQYMIGYNELTGQKLEGDPIAKETFLYLSQKLFSNFGYVNPHYLDYLEGRREVQKTQPISDDEIIEQNKKCFRRK